MLLGAGRLNPVETVSACWALKGDHEPQASGPNLNNPSPSSSHRGPGSAPYPIPPCPPCLEEETAYGGKPLPYSRERYLALARTAARGPGLTGMRCGEVRAGPLEDDARLV